jgi:hypothetical protein
MKIIKEYFKAYGSVLHDMLLFNKIESSIPQWIVIGVGIVAWGLITNVLFGMYKIFRVYLLI